MSRILLVEDDLEFRAALERLLLREGYQTLPAREAEEALTSLRCGEVSIHLVIADLHLCHASGLDLLAEARRREPPVPVIVLTAAPDTDSYLEALRLGAFEYLPKPLAPAEMLPLVRRALTCPGETNEKGKTA